MPSAQLYERKTSTDFDTSEVPGSNPAETALFLLFEDDAFTFSGSNLGSRFLMISFIFQAISFDFGCASRTSLTVCLFLFLRTKSGSSLHWVQSAERALRLHFLAAKCRAVFPVDVCSSIDREVSASRNWMTSLWSESAASCNGFQLSSVFPTEKNKQI